MTEERHNEILVNVFAEWKKDNRPTTDDEYYACTPMTTDEVREAISAVISCRNDEITEFMFENKYAFRQFGDHMAWIVCQQGDIE